MPERVDHRCDDARYEGNGLPHSVTLMPPRIESRWRWQGVFESTQFQLSPALVAKVAAEAFDLDPARVHFPARYYDRSSPEVVDTLKTLRNELFTGGPGGRLCAESLANVLVVHLIRQMANGPSTKEFARKPGGRLPRPAMRAVEEYIDAHLNQNFALADLAAVAHLSEFHFARQFKQTTGLPPYQFVIHQRVERAKRSSPRGISRSRRSRSRSASAIKANSPGTSSGSSASPPAASSEFSKNHRKVSKNRRYPSAHLFYVCPQATRCRGVEPCAARQRGR